MQIAGYQVQLYYLRLPNVGLALERVRRRVAAGGHDIPADVVRRRFERSAEMLREYYAPLVDDLFVFDWVDDDWSLTEERRRS